MSEAREFAPAFKRVVKVAAFAGLALLVQVGCMKSVEDQLLAAAVEVNKTCPKNVDAETRLDKTEVGPGKSFTYKYTMIHFAKADLDANKLNAALRPDIIKAYKTKPELNFFRSNDVTMHYVYADKNGEFVTEVVIEPKDLK